MNKLWFILGGVLIAIGILGSVMYVQGNEYTNEKDIMYMVSHSEYWSGEEGQIIARLYDWRGDPIIVDNCTVDIYYPDKTVFVSGALTDDSLQATTGTHYYNFTTPSAEGVYQYLATCNYNTKSRSVANSFHLSPALNFQINLNDSVTTLTAQELAHYLSLNDNMTTLITDLGIVDANVDELLIRTLDINNTVNGLDSGIQTIITTTGQINTTVNDLVVDVANVQIDTTYIRNNMMTQDNITIITDNQNDILNNISVLKTYCDDAETSGSQLCLWVSNINDQVNNINNTISDNDAILAEINSTTHSTYNYLTGTLATNINNIFGVSTQINSTVNNIETVSLQMNESINTIETNQEEVVYMEVTS